MIRTAGLVAFFLALVVLEVMHGLGRIETILASRRVEILEDVTRRHDALVDSLRPLLERNRRHARYLSSLPPVRDLLGANRGSTPAPEAHDRALQEQLARYLVCFREIDRVRILDPNGVSLFEVQRGPHDTLAVVPRRPATPIPRPQLDDEVRIAERRGALLRVDSELELLRRVLTGAAEEVVVSPVVVDHGRVEVPPTERQVIHYGAAVRNALGHPEGVVVLTVYASPMLNRVREFSPIAGSVASLVDGEGIFVAHGDRARELGGATPDSLRTSTPKIAEALLEGARELETAEYQIISSPVVAVGTPEESPAADFWRLVTWLHRDSLDAAASAGLQREYAWIIAGTVSVTVALGLAMAFFLRLNRRTIELRERQFYLEKEREMERQLETSERLASLGQLTAGVAHEINNPLEGIGNYLALLEREGLEAEKKQRYLGLVRHGFERIRDIVRDLSSFARTETISDRADVAIVVNQAYQLVRHNREFEAVEVTWRGFEQPIWIRGDAGRLEQVFINLLINAARAMQGRGHIEVSATLQDERLRITVEDDGPGIAPEDLGRIFDPFFSRSAGGGPSSAAGQSSSTGQNPGTGLGLAVSHGIIRVHGGQLTAENREKGGARFVIDLPLKKTEEEGSGRSTHGR